MRSLLAPLASAERTSVIAHYVHWETDDAPDVAVEAARCRICADDLVVAKSMGTMVLLEAVDAGQVPARAVLIGTPLKGYTESQVDGEDHVYADTEELASMIRQWWQPEGSARG